MFPTRLDYLNSLDLRNAELVEVTRKFLILAYVVLKHYRYQRSDEQPRYYPAFFGETIYEFCSIVANVDPKSMGLVEYTGLGELVRAVYADAVTEPSG